MSTEQMVSLLKLAVGTFRSQQVISSITGVPLINEAAVSCTLHILVESLEALQGSPVNLNETIIFSRDYFSRLADEETIESDDNLDENLWGIS